MMGGAAPPHEIVYYEDPSYTVIIDPRDRAIVRSARREMEMRFMHYNTNLNHVCSIKCRGYEVSAERDVPRLGLSSVITLGKSTEESSLPRDWSYVGHLPEDLDVEAIKRQPRIQAIDCVRSLYICQISGYVHQCPTVIEDRHHACRNTFEDAHGNVYCCFSGRLVYETYRAPYDPYVDTTIGAPRMMPSDEKSKKLERAVQLTEQRLLETRRTEEDRVVEFQKREETRDILRIQRNLSSALTRHGGGGGGDAPLPTLPLTTATFAPAAAVAVSKKRPAVSKGGGSARKKQALALGEGIRISNDNLRIIRNVLYDLAGDVEANEAVGKPNPQYVLQCGVEADDDYADYLITRVATVFALLMQYKNSTRDAIYGTIALRNVVVTTLYMYARGMSLSDGMVIIPADARLRDLLPRTHDIMWYGIDSELRAELLRKRERDTLLQLNVYKEAMVYSATQQIRHTFRIYANGPEALRKLLLEHNSGAT